MGPSSSTASSISGRIATNDPALAPVRAPIEDWLAKHEAEAVLVRPDRYVFGGAAPEVLARAWQEAVA